MSRPLGVTLLALLAFLNAILQGIAAMVSLFAPREVVVPFAQTAGPALGLGLVLVAMVYVLAGYGLWTLRPWGRVLMMVLAGIALAQAVAGAFVGVPLPGVLLGSLLNAVIIWYLWRPRTRAAFEYPEVIPPSGRMAA